MASIDFTVRKELQSLTEEEFSRFCLALQNFKNSPDWRNVVAIHGGGHNLNDPLIAKTVPELAKKHAGLTKGLERYPLQTDDWTNYVFCAHAWPGFLIWHRVYVRMFEKLLQKYDTEASKDKPPLGLPYWDWDLHNTLPQRALTPKVEVVLSGKKDSIDNPLLKGNRRPSRDEARQGSASTEETQRFNDSWIPLNRNDINQAHNVLSLNDYSVISYSAGKVDDLEDPHNSVHGNFTNPQSDDELYDMGDPEYAAWDPIFWLHHCNIERLHFQWIEAHPTHLPKVLEFRGDSHVDNPRPAQNIGLDSELPPFSTRKDIEDGKMFWDLDLPGTVQLSTIGDWIENKKLLYIYEVPKAHVESHNMMRIAARSMIQNSSHIVSLQGLEVQGSGFLELEYQNQAGKKVLLSKYLFQAPREICVMCESRVVLTLAWRITKENLPLDRGSFSVLFKKSQIDPSRRGTLQISDA